MILGGTEQIIIFLEKINRPRRILKIKMCLPKKWTGGIVWMRIKKEAKANDRPRKMKKATMKKIIIQQAKLSSQS